MSVRTTIQFVRAALVALLLSPVVGCYETHRILDQLDVGDADLEDGMDADDDGRDSDILSPTVDITSPSNGSVLIFFDDQNSILPNLQVDVSVFVEGAVGGEVVLLVDGEFVDDAEIAVDGDIFFDDITLIDGLHRIEASIRRIADEISSSPVEIRVDTIRPTCSILEPTLTTINQSTDLDATAPGGQIDVIVSTENSEDISVELIDNGETRAIESTTSGRATFPLLSFDEGNHDVHTVCWDDAGNWSASTSRALHVDTIAPDCEIISPECGSVFPVEYDDLPDLEGQQIAVQIRCTSDDIANIEVYVGGSPALPEPYGSSEELEAILYVTGVGGTWDYSLVAEDGAGNRIEKSCEFTLNADAAAVYIVQPTADSLFAVIDDLDHDMPGFQLDVMACTSLIGPVELRSRGFVVAADATFMHAECTTPRGDSLPFTVTFSGVSIGEGEQCLTIELTDSIGTTVSSPAVCVDVSL